MPRIVIEVPDELKGIEQAVLGFVDVVQETRRLAAGGKAIDCAEVERRVAEAYPCRPPPRSGGACGASRSGASARSAPAAPAAPRGAVRPPRDVEAAGRPESVGLAT